MENKLPYSYIAAQNVMQFTVALSEVSKRIDHLTNQAYYPYFASLPDNITINPFEAHLIEYDKSDYKVVNSSIVENNNQLARHYNRIIFNGAQTSYDSCKESMDLYLCIADSAEYTRDSYYLKSIFTRYGYKDGRLDKDAYIRTHGLHPDLIKAETLQEIMNRKEELLREEENAHNDFNGKMLAAAELVQLHLHPRTRAEKSIIKRLNQKIEKVDQYVTNMCGIVHDPLPTASETNQKQVDALKSGRKTLMRGLDLT